MRTVSRKLRLEQMEMRECPSATPLSTPATVSGLQIPQAIATDIQNLSTALNAAASNLLAHAPVGTEIHSALTALVDTAKLALDVRADTHAAFGGMIAPLVHSQIDEATLYFDFATGDTAGAKAAAANEQNDLSQLANSLAGTQDAGLAAEMFSQVASDFMNADNRLFGTG